ncbi:MAG TPA: hotdog fold thioesterase [Actinomycetales bacterium]|nr:hotdog fold thioesterase [Actinomycetales bacterium]
MRESTHTGPEPRLGITWTEDADGELTWHQIVADQVVAPEGRFALGGLAVLVDSALGSENHKRRPGGTWTVTTELRLDLLATPRAGSAGLGVRAAHLGDDGHCLTTRGEVLDDDGRVLAAGLVKSMEIRGIEGADEYDEEPPWESALVPGTLAEVLCLDLREAAPGPTGARTVEGVIAPEPSLANPIGALHGGVFAAAAETVGAALFSHERQVSSSSLDVRYVRQIPLVGPVTVRAEALHDGRSWGIAHVETRDERGRVCATATVTVYGDR